MSQPRPSRGPMQEAQPLPAFNTSHYGYAAPTAHARLAEALRVAFAVQLAEIVHLLNRLPLRRHLAVMTTFGTRSCADS